MKLIVPLFLAAFVAAGGLTVWAYSEPSTQTLRADIDEVTGQIAEAEEMRAKYEGGRIADLISYRLEILKLTKAMLEQKKRSILRRIDLTFTVEGRRLNVLSEEELQGIQEEIASTQKEIDSARAQAALYSGGLIQGLALMTAETGELTKSMLQNRYYAEKYGLAWLSLSERGGEPPEVPVGDVVGDDDAL